MTTPYNGPQRQPKFIPPCAQITSKDKMFMAFMVEDGDHNVVVIHKYAHHWKTGADDIMDDLESDGHNTKTIRVVFLGHHA